MNGLSGSSAGGCDRLRDRGRDRLRDRGRDRIIVFLVWFGLPILLSSCGTALFSADSVASAVFVSSLNLDGQGFAYLGNNNNVDTSQMWFIPSRINAISNVGVTGFLLGIGGGAVVVDSVAPDPALPNPDTSEERLLDNLTYYYVGSILPGQADWSLDTLAVSGAASGTDYMAAIALSGSQYVMGMMDFPTLTSSATLSPVHGGQGTSLLSVLVVTSWSPPPATGPTITGESISFDPSTGAESPFVSASGSFYRLLLPRRLGYAQHIRTAADCSHRHTRPPSSEQLLRFP